MRAIRRSDYPAFVNQKLTEDNADTVSTEVALPV
jgi:hypothetical protein